MLPFFVYGTLLPDQPNYALWQDGVRADEPARLAPGRLYDLGAYPMLVEEPGSGPVIGRLMHVEPAAYAWLVERLDALEGYQPHAPQASIYQRVVRAVQCVDGSRREAWVYVGQPAHVHGQPVVPGGDWATHAAGKQAEMRAWWDAFGRFL